MPSGTISGTHTTTVTLTTATYLNPVLVTGTITIAAGGGNALFGAAPTAWTVHNGGKITTADTAADGIYLDAGGSVTNGEAAIISGGRDGVYITGGTGAVTDYASISGVVNAGIELHDGGLASISSTGRVTGGTRGVVLHGPGTLRNQGRISDGSTLGGAVFMQGGGYVYNAAGARIGTLGTGINIYGGAGTVVNDGTVTGEGSAGLEGVALLKGGSVTNGLAAIIDGYYAGIALTGGLATVVNDGAVAGTGGANAIGIRVASGGTVSIGGNGSVSGTAIGMDFFNLPGYVTNAGMITGGATGSGAGIVLNFGGTVSNAIGATITGAGDGIYGLGSSVSVADLGQINGLGRIGVNLRGSGTVVVSGGVTGYDDGVVIGSGAGLLINQGGNITATATTGSAVALLAGGTVANYGGSIRGPIDGVYITGGAGTVVNSGEIGANVVDAVHLPAGYQNKLVVQPGAVFDGVADGGNTIGASVASMLELAAGTSAGVVGMIGGFGYGFTNFGTITIDQGATWDVTSSNTIAAGAALDSSGQLNVVFGNLANAGAIAAEVNVSLASMFTNQAGGTVTGPGGVAAVSMDVTDLGFGNAGSIFGSNVGVMATPGDSVTNSGLISSGGAGVEVGSGPPNSATSDVTNQAGARIAATSYGIEVTGGGATITNAGSITAIVAFTRSSGILLDVPGSVFNSGSIDNGGAYGVRLVDGGYVSNASTGVIGGAGRSGIYAKSGAATVINAGSIYNFSTRFADVMLNQGGSIDNEAGAVITSNYRAVYTGYGTTGGAGTVTNAGTISNTHSPHTALIVEDGGSVLNTGLIDSTTRGVYFGGGGTLTNSGTIAGTANLNEAVYFHGGFANRLIVDPGAVFEGVADGGNTIGATAVSTLELAPGSSAGTLSGLGSQYIDFAQTTVDHGATWTITGTNSLGAGATLANDGSIKLLAASFANYGLLTGPGVTSIDPSTLVVNDVGGGGTIEVGSSSTLTVEGTVAAGETITFTGTNGVVNVMRASSFAGTITNQGSTNQVNIACFTSGTGILTAAGEVSVEQLLVGDQVATLNDRRFASIVWLGHRRVDCLRHERLSDVCPVRVHSCAFGHGLPERDLLLSPDHAVFLEGALIPISYLINGSSIVQEQVDEVTYYHVELAAHDVILAEGLPCESYLDTGNRATFEVEDGASPEICSLGVR